MKEIERMPQSLFVPRHGGPCSPQPQVFALAPCIRSSSWGAGLGELFVVPMSHATIAPGDSSYLAG